MFGWTLLGTGYTDDTGEKKERDRKRQKDREIERKKEKEIDEDEGGATRIEEIGLRIHQENCLVYYFIYGFSVLVKGEDDGTLTHLNGPWENVCRSANEDCSNVPGKIIVLRGKFGDLYSSLHPDGYE
ncbi:hypothetical protein HZH68_015517 [Vespula germanica]|uniref:Uncharacterized protein n=1 Tax=Vespula germanica TaxID=30212 RepID=A0A834J6H3_VESGE|nr:hypothetical protein HZH68_015517 [Vespula germanica]